MRHDIESCDQGGEDQDMTWLDGPVASVKGCRHKKCVNALAHGKPEGSAQDEPGDPLGFNAGPADPMNSRRHASQFDLQLTMRESLSVN